MQWSIPIKKKGLRVWAREPTVGLTPWCSFRRWPTWWVVAMDPLRVMLWIGLGTGDG